MAFLFGDTFDDRAIGERFMKWNSEYGAVNGTVSFPTTGRRGTKAFRFATSGGAASNQPHPHGVIVPAVGTTAIAQFAFAHRSQPLSGLGQVLSDDPGSGSSINQLINIRYFQTSQIWIRINTDGTLNVYRGTTLIAGPSSAGVSQDVMHYIKVKVIIADGTGGSVLVNIDGTDVLNVGSLDTRQGGAGWNEAVIGAHQGASGTNWDYDDFILCDGDGSDCNDIMPDLRGDDLYPNANGNSNQSTPSGGAVDRYTMVDETDFDASDYNSLAAVNDKDTYGLQNHPVSGSTVKAMTIEMGCQKDDAGSPIIRSVFRTGGTDYAGSDKGVPVDPLLVRQIYMRSPVDGTTALSTSLIDGAEIGAQKNG